MQTIPVPGSELSLGLKNLTVGWSKPLTYLVSGFVCYRVVLCCVHLTAMCAHTLLKRLPDFSCSPNVLCCFSPDTYQNPNKYWLYSVSSHTFSLV